MGRIQNYEAGGGLLVSGPASVLFDFKVPGCFRSASGKPVFELSIQGKYLWGSYVRTGYRYFWDFQKTNLHTVEPSKERHQHQNGWNQWHSEDSHAQRPDSQRLSAQKPGHALITCIFLGCGKEA